MLPLLLSFLEPSRLTSFRQGNGNGLFGVLYDLLGLARVQFALFVFAHYFADLLLSFCHFHKDPLGHICTRLVVLLLHLPCLLLYVVV